MSCKITRKKFRALWDSRAQLSLSSFRWLQKNWYRIEEINIIREVVTIEEVGGEIVLYIVDMWSLGYKL